MYRHLLIGGAMCVAGLGVFSCSDKYDLDTEQPEGLNSIYGYLEQEGNYSTAMRLIEDLGQKEILSRTGSKTMFVADDDAYRAFFASNPWGVRSYEQLSLAQKKLLLNSSMIDNPYTTSMLSTATGPVKGEVCRRASSVTIYDSVLTVQSKSALADKVLPSNVNFDRIRANRDQIVLFTDNSIAAPMVNFTEKFLTSNKVQRSDIDFIYNQPRGTRQADDVYINNAIITEPNIFCTNGFIHKVDRVIFPLDNMADVIRKKPQMSIYNSIIERFAAPEYSESYTRAYNLNKGTEIDSVFIKRYYSKRSYGSTSSNGVQYDGNYSGVGVNAPVGASLKFDPGWNAYVPEGTNTRDAMQEDLAVMLVPTDAAIKDWWNNGGGAVIKDFYGTIEATPNSVLDDLVNVNQINSFVQYVPSRFSEILNDANEPLGVTTADVDSVFLACNGVVYMTNKVFAPASYSSVLFPSVIDTTQFSVIANAIESMEYHAYLNSMVANYTFLIPTNTGMLSYIDPVSYGRTGETKAQMWQFTLDQAENIQESARMVATVYDCTLTESGWVADGDSKKTINGGFYTLDDNGKKVYNNNNNLMKDRFEDMLDNIIVTEKYQPGKKYYMTKGRTFVRIDGNEKGSTVKGSLQTNRTNPPQVKEVYNMKNGTTLVLDEIPLSTNKSVAKVLNEHREFSDFYEILTASGAINKTNSKDNWFAGDQVFGNLYNQKIGGQPGAEDLPSTKTKANYLLNNYHYTLYVPTNDAMKKAYEKGLPTTEDLNNAAEWDTWYKSLDKIKDEETLKELAEKGMCKGDSAARIREVMLDFVKYHIQDNAVFLDQGFNVGSYGTGKSSLLLSTETNADGKQLWSPGRSYTIDIQNLSSSGMTIKDNIGEVHHVVTSGNLYNLMAREYWYTGAGTTNSTPSTAQLNNSSFVVIHAIDGPLIYADGEHWSLDGTYKEPTQFKYLYKPLSITE